MRDKEIINSYIEKALELKEKAANASITREELLEIAEELGLAPEDLKEIDKTATNHRIRAANYINNDCWEEAIKELKTAQILRPGDPEIQYLFALAHLNQYRDTNSKLALRQGEEYAKKCIELNPEHKKAYTIIKQIKNPETLPQKSQKYRQNGARKALLFFALTALSLIGFILFYTEAPQKTDYEPSSVKIISESAYEEKSSSEVSEDSTKQSVEKEVIKTGKRNIPISVINTENSGGVAINVRESIITPYDTAFSYELKADITLKDITVKELKYKIALFNEKGILLYADFMTAQDDYRPPAIPGDTLPANKLIYKDEKEKNVAYGEVTIDFINKEPYIASKTVYPDVELHWPIPKPGDVELILRERQSSSSSGFGTSYNRLTFEVVNKGPKSIEILVLGVEWLNDQGEVIAQNKSYISASGNPTFLPGQQRIGFFIQRFSDEKNDIKSYKVKVQEIR